MFSSKTRQSSGYKGSDMAWTVAGLVVDLAVLWPATLCSPSSRPADGHMGHHDPKGGMSVRERACVCLCHTFFFLSANDSQSVIRLDQGLVQFMRHHTRDSEQNTRHLGKSWLPHFSPAINKV